MLTNGLGSFVRSRRLHLGLSQEELAERLGGSVNRAEVSRLERGSVAFPRRRRLEALAAALEVTIGRLLIESRWLSCAEDKRVERRPLPHSLWSPPPPGPSWRSW